MIITAGCYPPSTHVLPFIFLLDKRWISKALQLSKKWQQHIQQYLGSKISPTLVVKYEDLITDLYTQLKRMMEFMKFPYTEEDLQCTINSSMERFHRKHRKNMSDPYPAKLKNFVKSQIEMANNVLRAYKISY